MDNKLIAEELTNLINEMIEKKVKLMNNRYFNDLSSDSIPYDIICGKVRDKIEEILNKD